MIRLLVGYGGSTAYGSSDGTTVNTALYPSDLYEGSIGIYGVLKSSGETTLITAGATYANWERIQIFQGAKADPVTGRASSITFGGSDLGDVAAIATAAYVAPVKQVSYIGYTGSAGTLNLPTIAVGDSGLVGVAQKEATMKTIIPYSEQYDSGSLAASATGYAILRPIADGINFVNGINNSLRKVIADIKAQGTYTKYTGTAGVMTVTNGSNVVTWVTAVPTGATAGTFIAINTAAASASAFATAATDSAAATTIYKIASVDSATQITLDSPYQGATATITNANQITNGWISAFTLGTLYGLKLTAYNFEEGFTYSVGGVLTDATITYSTAMTYGVGTPAQLAIMEASAKPYRGGIIQSVNPNSSPVANYIDSTKTYDQYTFTFQPKHQVNYGANSVGTNTNWMNVAFVLAANTGGLNQCDFEDIILGFNTAGLLPSFTEISA